MCIQNFLRNRTGNGNGNGNRCPGSREQFSVPVAALLGRWGNRCRYRGGVKCQFVACFIRSPYSDNLLPEPAPRFRQAFVKRRYLLVIMSDSNWRANMLGPACMMIVTWCTMSRDVQSSAVQTTNNATLMISCSCLLIISVLCCL